MHSSRLPFREGRVSARDRSQRAMQVACGVSRAMRSTETPRSRRRSSIVASAALPITRARLCRPSEKAFSRTSFGTAPCVAITGQRLTHASGAAASDSGLSSKSTIIISSPQSPRSMPWRCISRDRSNTFPSFTKATMVGDQESRSRAASGSTALRSPSTK